MSLKNVRVVKEPKVIDLNTRRRQIGCANSDKELLVLTQWHPFRLAGNIASPNPEAQPHGPGPLKPICTQHLDVARERLSNGAQVG